MKENKEKYVFNNCIVIDRINYWVYIVYMVLNLFISFHWYNAYGEDAISWKYNKNCKFIIKININNSN